MHTYRVSYVLVVDRMSFKNTVVRALSKIHYIRQFFHKQHDTYVLPYVILSLNFEHLTSVSIISSKTAIRVNIAS